MQNVVILQNCERDVITPYRRMSATSLSHLNKIMNDILLKVDFPVKPQTLYLYKGKYKVVGDKILEGVNVIKTCKCSEGYFSYTSIKFGGFEYHNETPTELIGQKFFGGEWYEIIDGG
jgi:hypothetical protein